MGAKVIIFDKILNSTCLKGLSHSALLIERKVSPCSLHLAHVSNSASKSQLFLFQSPVCFLLISQNFLLVQQKCDTKCKEWEAVGEVEATFMIWLFSHFWDFLQTWLFSQIWHFRQIWHFHQNWLFRQIWHFRQIWLLLSKLTIFSNYMVTLT